MLRKKIYQLPKLFFVLTELCLSALQVIDVSIRSIPVDNVARFVAQWLSPKQEPSITPSSSPPGESHPAIPTCEPPQA